MSEIRATCTTEMRALMCNSFHQSHLNAVFVSISCNCHLKLQLYIAFFLYSVFILYYIVFDSAVFYFIYYVTCSSYIFTRCSSYVTFLKFYVV